MKYIRWFKLAILCGLTLMVCANPGKAAAEDGISIIYASDIHFFWYLEPDKWTISRNQLVANAMNQIEELGKWPAQDSSKLIYGYDAPIILPSGVIANGDLTHDWTHAQAVAFNEWQNMIAYPKYPGLGNHDYYENTPACGPENGNYYQPALFWPCDPYRSGKEGIWWMANQIETNSIPNIVSRDLIGYVGLKSYLDFRRSRIGVRFWMLMPPDYEDSVSVVTWSDPIGLAYPQHGFRWGFVRLPERAERVYIQRGKTFGGWEIVDSFPAPGSWEAQCYMVDADDELLGPYYAEEINRPREWPGGNIGSLAYSYDIGPYYHFVQLHLRPDHESTFPGKRIYNPLAVINAPDAFYWDWSPGVTITNSYTWLKQDLKAATEAGKYIVINMHECSYTDEFKEAIKDRNVVAIFYGHSHGIGPKGYIANTYNDSTYHIPRIECGAAFWLNFLLTMFNRTYFNVGVIMVDSASAQHAFVVDVDKWLAETFMIPKMFLANADPTVAASLLNETPVYEGDTLSFLAVGEDADGDTLLYEWDFGDGSQSSGENPVHIYGDNGVYAVSVTVDDQHGGTGTDAFQVTVENATPIAAVDSILGPAGELIIPGQEASFYGSFCDPGYLDNHTARWDFGDGHTVSGTVSEENELPEATGTVTGTHIYGQSGMFTVVLYVQDDDGGEDTVAIDIMVMSPLEPDLVDQIDSIIQILPSSCFKGPAKQHKNALSNKLAAVKKSMAAGSLMGAINKLTNDIRAKMDGLVDGEPQDDWIIDEEAQVELCELIDQLIDYLESGGPAGTESHPTASAEDSESELSENLPAEFSLSQNKPNPFNATTHISFTLPYATHVNLSVYNIRGQKVATLIDGQLGAGEHTYQFGGSTFASGIYLYRIRAGDFIETRRMLLLK